jgi:hypothetical protein
MAFSRKPSICSNPIWIIISESLIFSICLGVRSNVCGLTHTGISEETSTYSHPMLFAIEARGTIEVTMFNSFF